MAERELDNYLEGTIHARRFKNWFAESIIRRYLNMEDEIR
jgi:hypothetical protein